jgi:hypothetical protein
MNFGLVEFYLNLKKKEGMLVVSRGTGLYVFDVAKYFFLYPALLRMTLHASTTGY